MSNEIRLENIKRLQKIANEINLIYQQIKDENVLKTLHDENAQRFIFVSLIKISESFKKIKESADDEILSLFDKKDLKRINDTRNFAAHDNEEIRLSAVANVIKYDLFRVKRSINIYMGKLENQKQEVEIMENVVRKKGLSLNAKIITALLVAIVLALSLLLSMIDAMNTTNIIKEKFVTFIDRLSYSEIVFLSMITFISIVICLVLIMILVMSKHTSSSGYKDYEYNQNFEENDTGNSYPTDALNPLSFTQGLYKD
ncbi:hypothetical protein ACS0H5_001610 [Campylobacter lari]|nr:hypothetical protein [Campylobacter lari]EAJ5683530.1 hypothetical protein [Campylobacter lari]EAJ5698946.1 hypothetical protein [Campylobacter lari]EAJ5700527.1 hypothetical protein [Campylobacter lari]EAW0606572.1 hypothetical protein [Campylobacter lari]